LQTGETSFTCLANRGGEEREKEKRDRARDRERDIGRGRERERVGEARRESGNYI
jgi:hypothetical protein